MKKALFTLGVVTLSATQADATNTRKSLQQSRLQHRIVPPRRATTNQARLQLRQQETILPTQLDHAWHALSSLIDPSGVVQTVFLNGPDFGAHPGHHQIDVHQIFPQSQMFVEPVRTAIDQALQSQPVTREDLQTLFHAVPCHTCNTHGRSKLVVDDSDY